VSDDEGPVFPCAPPERIELEGGLALVRPSAHRAASAVASINASLGHLQPWMAWAAQPATEAGMSVFFESADQLWSARRDFLYSIVDSTTDAVIGGSGLHARDGTTGLEIGYWVHVDRIGHGIATAAARALTTAAFTIPGIERVRIHCKDDNVRSARVPEKLGFRHVLTDRPDDGVCAGQLRQRWEVERDDWEARLEPRHA
jgi:RimJ/RimL family protein N-acetyltransferase